MIPKLNLNKNFDQRVCRRFRNLLNMKYSTFLWSVTTCKGISIFSNSDFYNLKTLMIVKKNVINFVISFNGVHFAKKKKKKQRDVIDHRHRIAKKIPAVI